MNPETQAEKPLGAGNSQSGPSKSPPPLPAKNGDLPLLPSAMMFQKVLEKNNFAVVAGVMLVGFGVCMVGTMVFVGIVNRPDNKQPGNQVAEGPVVNTPVVAVPVVVEGSGGNQPGVLIGAGAKGKNPKNYSYDKFDPLIEMVDMHAFSATKEQEKDIETLASYLGVFGKKYSPANEYLQVRAIYSWITNNIKYDNAALVDGVTRDNDAVQVFKSKKAVCHGQAVLFKAFCDELKIKCHVVTGPVKIEDGKLGEHAWNAVEIHGEWRLLDCTWGCMVYDEKNEVSPEVRLALYMLNEFYFLTPPELLILNHFTKDPDWQLLKTPKTLEQFVKDPNYLAKNCLLMNGVPLSVLADFVQKNSMDDVVFTFPVFCPIQVVAMPLHRKLEINKKYKFAFKVPANFRIDIKMGESISQPMIKDKEGNYVAEITINKVAPVHIVLWDKENKIDGGYVFAIYNYVKKD